MIYINGTPTDDTTLPMVLWDNLLSRTTTTIASSTAATDYPAVNAIAETTYNYWQPTAIPAWISGDLGSAMTVNSFAIVAHNLFTCAATVYLQSSPDNIAWTTRSNSITPTDNTPILGIFVDTSARYWRLYIASSTGNPTIGNLIVGDRFVLPGGVMPPYTPIWQAQKVDLLMAKSLGGQFLGNRVLRQGAETSISLVSISRTFGEVDIQPFKSWYNGGHAFIWASGPSIFTNDVGYVWRKPNAEMRPTFTETGSWIKVTMEVEGYVQ
jgi:F5/8 type C domain